MAEGHEADLINQEMDEEKRVDEQGKEIKSPEGLEELEEEKEAEEGEEKEEIAAQEIEALRRELEEQRQKAEEYLDQWRRTAAEFANYRKRNDRERELFTKMSNASLIKRLLPVLDDLQRALQTLPDNLRDLTWVEGIILIERKLNSILEQEGLSAIKAEGKPFDPNLHEAILYEETSDYEEGTVIAELQKGYMLHEQVLRPTLVKVARAPEEAKGEDEKEEIAETK